MFYIQVIAPPTAKSVFYVDFEECGGCLIRCMGKMYAHSVGKHHRVMMLSRGVDFVCVRAFTRLRAWVSAAVGMLWEFCFCFVLGVCVWPVSTTSRFSGAYATRRTTLTDFSINFPLSLLSLSLFRFVSVPFFLCVCAFFLFVHTVKPNATGLVCWQILNGC